MIKLAETKTFGYNFFKCSSDKGTYSTHFQSCDHKLKDYTHQGCFLIFLSSQDLRWTCQTCETIVLTKVIQLQKTIF